MIRITAQRDGFRRCGMAHSKAPRQYPDDRFSQKELAILCSEPMLFVEVVKGGQEKAPGGSGDPGAELLSAAKICVDEGKTIASGKPDVKAMAEILGREVTAAERDAAWAKLQAGSSQE